MFTRRVSDVDKLLEDGEELETTVHPSRWRREYWQNVGGAGLIALGIAGAFVVQEQLPAFITSWMLTILFLAPLFFMARAEFEHMSHMYHFTSRKLIVETGVFSKDFMTVPYDRITQVTIDQSVNDRMLGIGNLRAEILGSDQEELVVRAIKNPQRFRVMLAERGDAGAAPEDAPAGKPAVPADAADAATQEVEQLDRGELETELGRVQRERHRLEEAYNAGDVSEEEYERRWYVLEGEERIIQRQLDRLDE